MKMPKLHRWWVLLLSLLILASALPCAAAEQTQDSFTITAVIPGSHKLLLHMDGPGSVSVDGRSFTEDTTLVLDRHSQPLITVEPDLLCQLRLLTIDGVAFAKNANGHSFTLDPLTRDISLKAEFYAAPAVVVSAVILTSSGAVIGAALLSTETAATAVTGQSLVRRILAALKRKKKT